MHSVGRGLPKVGPGYSNKSQFEFSHTYLANVQGTANNANPALTLYGVLYICLALHTGVYSRTVKDKGCLHVSTAVLH